MFALNVVSGPTIKCYYCTIDGQCILHLHLSIRVSGFPVMEKHGTKFLSWKVMENGHKNKVMKKSLHFSTAYRESRLRNSDNSIFIGLLQWFGCGRLSVYVPNSKS